MNIRIKNVLLIGSVVASVILSSCKKDDDDSASSSGTTPTVVETTGTFTDSRDGKTYKWVKIGEQIWMAEDLAYTGDDIRHILSDVEWENNSSCDGWCYYNNSDSLGKIYGVLYQWEAAKKACPEGWHLSTFDEWNESTTYMMRNGYSCDGDAESGRMLAKALATDNGWDISDHQYAVGNTDYPKYRNKSGFSARPTGKRSDNGSFWNLGQVGFFWSEKEKEDDDIWYWSISTNNYNTIQYYANKRCGEAVRCVKD